MRLDRFHLVLGAAMGWQDSHLHVFERGMERYGFADPELDIRDDREVTIGALLVEPGDRLVYEYDFGDCWEHDIVLVAIEGADGEPPCCIDGAGRCPPEDVGGTPGYEDLRRVRTPVSRRACACSSSTGIRSAGWASRSRRARRRPATAMTTRSSCMCRWPLRLGCWMTCAGRLSTSGSARSCC